MRERDIENLTGVGGGEPETEVAMRTSSSGISGNLEDSMRACSPGQKGNPRRLEIWGHLGR